MPRNIAVQNSFIGGLKTEFTGLNFPENSCTDVSNCVFSIIGDVLRREGIDFEANFAEQSVNSSGQSISTYRWRNAGGDGTTDVLVVQVGTNLYFFQSSNSTTASPLSTTFLSSATISISTFLAAGSPNNPALAECQYSDGNGFLFVYHPYCDPFYCTFTSGVIHPTLINVQIRDFNGIPDQLSVTARPNSLPNEHAYNLENQGWGVSSAYWSGTTSSIPPLRAALNVLLGSRQVGYSWGITTGSWTLNATIQNPSNIVVGQAITISGTVKGPTFVIVDGPLRITVSGDGGSGTLSGIVTGYPGSGNVITIDITDISGFTYVPLNTGGFNFTEFGQVITPDNNPAEATWSFSITPNNVAAGNQLSTWHSAFNNYPSNADIWWIYKNTSNVFDPVDTIANVTFPTSPAPKGHFILNAFSQQFSLTSNLPGLTPITTIARPQTGCWFQGRVFYTGVNASQAAVGDQNFYTWTENIYFSQIIDSLSNPEFGLCYQTNDPTDQNFFDILPSDGGVITIQGIGNIYKLFPVQNGIIVFGQNGMKFITGSQGIGFAANDYTVTDIPGSVQSISSTSFINVRGYPVFWNEEGIYTVEPSQQGLTVNPLTVGTILSFYNNIPKDSKRYVRGDYDPLTYVIQWVYRSTQESGIANRYQYDSILALNIYNKAFYPYTIGNNSSCYISGINYMTYPNSITSPDPTFKYLTTVNSTALTFSEERDGTNWVDYHSFDNVGVSYTSFFETGFSLAGKAVSKWQPTYVTMYHRSSGEYTIQGIWDYASSPNSGAYSTIEKSVVPLVITYASGIASPPLTEYGMYYRRHKIRGHGEALQLRVSSVPRQPFDVMGWSVLQNIDEGV